MSIDMVPSKTIIPINMIFVTDKSRDCSDEVDGSSDFVETSCDEYNNNECSGTKKKNLQIRKDPLSLTVIIKIYLYIISFFFFSL